MINFAYGFTLATLLMSCAYIVIIKQLISKIQTLERLPDENYIKVFEQAKQIGKLKADLLIAINSLEEIALCSNAPMAMKVADKALKQLNNIGD